MARFDPRTPASNKLRMLELADTHDFDVLLAIDTDTIVLGDVGRYADPERRGGQAGEPRPVPAELLAGDRTPRSASPSPAARW